MANEIPELQTKNSTAMLRTSSISRKIAESNRAIEVRHFLTSELDIDIAAGFNLGEETTTGSNLGVSYLFREKQCVNISELNPQIELLSHNNMLTTDMAKDFVLCHPNHVRLFHLEVERLKELVWENEQFEKEVQRHVKAKAKYTKKLEEWRTLRDSIKEQNKAEKALFKDETRRLKVEFKDAMKQYMLLDEDDDSVEEMPTLVLPKEPEETIVPAKPLSTAGEMPIKPLDARISHSSNSLAGKPIWTEYLSKFKIYTITEMGITAYLLKRRDTKLSWNLEGIKDVAKKAFKAKKFNKVLDLFEDCEETHKIDSVKVNINFFQFHLTHVAVFKPIEFDFETIEDDVNSIVLPPLAELKSAQAANIIADSGSDEVYKIPVDGQECLVKSAPTKTTLTRVNFDDGKEITETISFFSVPLAIYNLETMSQKVYDDEF